jgi:Cof subfamily protein (haloacid dehalogenase superfamily)
MMDFKLIALDLDGTLLTNNHSLAPEGMGYLRRAYLEGVHIVLATMRNPLETTVFCQELGIDDPLICANGAWVLGSPNGPNWEYRTIPQDIALKIAQLADQNGWELVTTVASTTYLRQRPGQLIGSFETNKEIVAINVDGIVGDPIRMLVFDSEGGAVIQEKCKTELQANCQTEIFINPDGSFHSLAIGPVNTDKGTGLRLVMDHFHLPREQILAIGDNYVDLPMFQQAGTSVAMGNAPEAVKKGATTVAPANDEEGVAWALKTFQIVKETI